MTRGIRIRVSSYTPHHVNAVMCRPKVNGNYMNSMMALKDALDTDYDEVCFADEAFFTGSAAEVTPIREVDGPGRRRQPRPDHREAAEQVFRRRARPHRGAH